MSHEAMNAALFFGLYIGIVLWELITRKKPYAGLSKAKFYEKVIQGGTRPVIPKKWPKELRALISECWR